MFVGNLQTWGIPVQVQWKIYETFLTKGYNLFWLEEIPVTTICSMKSGKLMTGFPQIHSDWSMDWLIDRLIPYHAIQEVIISALQSEIFGQSVLHHLVAVLASPCAEVTGPKNPLNPRTWNDTSFFSHFCWMVWKTPKAENRLVSQRLGMFPISKTLSWEKSSRLSTSGKTVEDRCAVLMGDPGAFCFSVPGVDTIWEVKVLTS